MDTSATLNQKIREKRARIAVIGLGYVGLPLAVEKAKVGYTVVGIERNADRVAMVNRGENYIGDVVPDDLAAVVRAGRLRATQDFSVVADVDVVTICVPTPLDKNKQPDTSYIEFVVEQSLPYIHPGQLIVLESTTYPGTTEEIIQSRLEERGFVVGRDVFVAFSPERVDPGNVQFKTKNTPKVVGGVTPACTEVAAALYEEVLEGGVFQVSSPRVAEMTKILENTFRIVNISLVNELALLCERMDIDIWEVIEAAKTKPFGYMPFYPGPGLGGHCIPLDPFYLSWKAKAYDFSTRFIELAGQVNDEMPHHVVERSMLLLNESGKSVRGAKILVLGVAYKRDIDDTRESPALKIMSLLVQLGAVVQYHDPYIASVVIEGQEYVSQPLSGSNLRAADLVLIATDHTKVDYESVTQNAVLVFDTRNATSGTSAPNVRRLGVGGKGRS
jgi:UDP-N-acetyl-D-glucosamine dehydrogenase